MYKTIDIERLFYKQNDSYDVINISKEAEFAGYKYVKVNNLVTRLSIRYFMYIVVTLSNDEKKIKEILCMMKNMNNWIKNPIYRYYEFKLLNKVL